MRRAAAAVLVVGICFLNGVLLHAQSTNASITGLVMDPSKAVIVGAKVTAINQGTDVHHEGVTNGTGSYYVTNLPPGTYRVEVEKTGFKTVLKPSVTLHVQDTVELNFEMALGSASESVTVEGGAPLVNTQDAAVSTVIDRTFVENLPLNGRSFNTLLQLTPGVVLAASPNSRSTGQYSIAGQRTDANSFSVDGVSANFGVQSSITPGASGLGGAQAFSAFGGTSSLVSVDALQEFRIETSSFAPELGRTPGGQVILTTRSGTNDFHGGIYEYFRNTVMDANDWFANATRKPRAPEHHNDFGGFLGGPVRKNKTFFFFSYEGARLDLPQSQNTPVPSQFARTTAPAALAPYLNAFPQPDDRSVTPGVYTSQFTGVFSNRATLNAASLRIDHKLNDRFTVFGRYNFAPSNIANRVGTLSTLNTSRVNTQTLTFGVDMLLTNAVTDTLRWNYSTQRSSSVFTSDSFGGAAPLNPSLLLGSLSLATNQAAFQPGDTFTYIIGQNGRNPTRQFNVVNSLTLAKGTHQIRVGGDYRAIFLDVNPYQHQILILPSSVQAFDSSGKASLFLTTLGSSHFLAHSLSLFAQDNWKLTSRLTLTYGVRWELSPAPSARGTTTLASWTNVNDPTQIALAPAGTPLWSTRYGNVAPRLGIAYRLTEKGDLVLRAGGGIFYDIGMGASANLGAFFPNNVFSFVASATLPVLDFTPVLPALTTQPPFPTVNAFSPTLTLPRSYQWNLSVEKSFAGRRAITASYVGQAGRDLLRQEALSSPNANFAPSSLFELTVNDALSNYHALQLQYRKPLSSGLQALLNYTWSHSLDNASNDTVIGLSNTIISAASDYASSDFDVRHSISGALTYSVPRVSKSGAVFVLTRDWSIDAAVVARTGFPFNAVVTATSPVGGGITTRPDRVAGQPLWISNPLAGGGKSLNPKAFVNPSTKRQGTEGRNDIPGFGLTQVDLSIGRKFPITEGLNLQFRADAFNALNHPNFANPRGNFLGTANTTLLKSSQMLNVGLQGLNPLFQEGGPRSLQLSLRLLF